MLMPLNKIVTKFRLNIRGVLHIGAHYGQEYKDYKTAGINNMIFFEPVKSNFAKLVNNLSNADPEVILYNIGLGNESGLKEIYIEKGNDGMSCSLLEPIIHLQQYPGITFKTKEFVTIDKLDNIQFDRSLHNMINIDVQGYELEVFKGAIKSLENIDIIYTEVNRAEVYKGCARIEEIDLFLNNFTRVKTQWDGITWGDALYLKQ